MLFGRRVRPALNNIFSGMFLVIITGMFLVNITSGGMSLTAGLSGLYNS